MFHRVLERLWALQGLTCREVTRLAANAMDRRLSYREQLRLFMHGLLCGYCRKYMRQLRFLRKWMQQMGIPDASPRGTGLPPASVSRVKKTLAKEVFRIE